MKTFVITILGLIVSFCAGAAAQTENDMKFYLQQIDRGQTDAVNQALPQLIAQYENTPDLAYLQGRLASDGTEAMKHYRSVVENYPKSEWADESLYRIFEYDYATGSYTAVHSDINKLKTDYPNSPYIAEETKVKVPTGNDKALTISVPPGDTPINNSTTVVTPPNNSRMTPTDTVQAVMKSSAYSIQVGAFSTSANAEKQKGYFERSGYSAEITTKVVENKSLYLVWVGTYASLDDAKAASSEIRKKFKITPMVIER